MGRANAYFLLRLLQSGGIGPARVRKIVDWLQNAKSSCAAVSGDEIELRQILGEESFQAYRQAEAKTESLVELLEKEGIVSISIFDFEYPASLHKRLGRRAPPLIFCRGNLELFDMPGIGFCGSRKASAKGIDTATDLADQLARKEIAVVSGYAHGVDMAAHLAALNAGGNTIIVLPEGITHFRIKRDVKDAWDWKRVLVVSEFSPTMPWSAANAMRRNETICGLAKAMVVIEAGETGGTMEAGKSALEMKVPLFVAVYEGAPDSAVGNEILLERGGYPVKKSRVTMRGNIAAMLNAATDSPTDVSSVQGSLRFG